jgi:hypothetical protein
MVAEKIVGFARGGGHTSWLILESREDGWAARPTGNLRLDWQTPAWLACFAHPFHISNQTSFPQIWQFRFSERSFPDLLLDLADEEVEAGRVQETGVFRFFRKVGVWNGDFVAWSMSQSLLYHAFGVREGYDYVETLYENGCIRFVLEARPELLVCPDCHSKEVSRKGRRFRELQTVPIGLKPVFLVTEVPKCQCRDCGKTFEVSPLLPRPTRPTPTGCKPSLRISTE